MRDRPMSQSFTILCTIHNTHYIVSNEQSAECMYIPEHMLYCTFQGPLEMRNTMHMNGW